MVSRLLKLVTAKVAPSASVFESDGVVYVVGDVVRPNNPSQIPGLDDMSGQCLGELRWDRSVRVTREADRMGCAVYRVEDK